ncbi:MAG: toll/interleukin-1 receptor domain-containing protein [Bacteroidetes bacterium]|nr:toll/interleukin-1 receptor domain-containing protein [Bacteroidota bacterium]
MNIDSVIDNLIHKYTSGNLIPIIGCELFKVPTEQGNSINIHEYIIRESFYPSEEWPEPPALLSELPLAIPEFDYNSLLGCYKLLNEKKKRLKFLTQLANLKYFKIFLIANVFKEFETEFRKNNNEEVEIYKNDTITMHGLPSINFNNGLRKIIYLFDNLDSPLCAINDEELLESMYSLANSPKHSSDNSLLSYLQNKTLLFIGCDFPDLFMRYCIRVLSNNPFSSRPIYIVNDHPTKLKYQEFFFAKHNIKLIHTSPVDDFVDKFYQKALKKEEFKNKYENSQIFISYSKSHDLVVAKSLYHKFREQGVVTYFDEETQTIGSHENEIKDYIMNPKTKMLLSVISEGLFNTLSSDLNYIRDIEWYSAKARNDVAAHSNIHKKINIVPYFVDNERNYIDKLPELIKSEFRFGENHGGFDRLFSETKNIIA